MGTGPARAVAARMGIEALVYDDAVQVATAGTTAPSGVGGALVNRHGAGQTRRGRRGSHLVVAVPVAPLAQQRGDLFPQRVLEVCRRRPAERLVDRRFEQLRPAAENSLVDAAAVAPSGQRLRGRHQLLVVHPGRPSAGAPQAAIGVLGIVGGRGVRLLAGEVLSSLVAAYGAAGQELVGYVDAGVVDVAQQPVVPVAVGLAAVGDQLDDAADRRELLLEQVGCLVGVALSRRRRVGDFGGVDASLG